MCGAVKSHLVSVAHGAKAGRDESGGGKGLGEGGRGLGWVGRVGGGGRSDAEGHVAEQPLLRAAVVAVSQRGHHLVLLGRHVQALVAVDVQQRQSLHRPAQTDTRRQSHKCDIHLLLMESAILGE